jgi:ribonuclease VapC
VTSAVLDASALLALLLGEPGGEKVRPLVSDSAITSVNLAEIVGFFARGGRPETDIRRMLRLVPFQVVDFDEELAYAAGMLLPLTRAAGLSLGDRACLALARRIGVTALTADRAWMTVGAAAGVVVQPIR